MRSWLAQSLRALEDMVDSGELSEEELKALARTSIMPSVSTMPPSLIVPEQEGALALGIDEFEGPADWNDVLVPDDTGVHPSQPASTREPPAYPSGTMPSVELPAALRTGTKK